MAAVVARLGRLGARGSRAAWRIFAVTFRTIVAALVVVVVFIIAGNLTFHSQRGIPYRALAPEAAACSEGRDVGWDVLAKTDGGQVANDEWSAIEKNGPSWRAKFSCTIQHHVIRGYRVADGSARTLEYDLAFIEFQEDGKPYALRVPCTLANDEGCRDEGYGPVRLSRDRGQLDAVLDSLKSNSPHYVLVWIHGWRHDASIGDANVSEFREYAAHVARFIEDRAAINPQAPKPRVTAIYIGWRGARTEENWLRHTLGTAGAWMGNFFAVATLFDRKPVSEAIAPSVLAGVRAVESILHLYKPITNEGSASRPGPNRMIVFGHSLGGNLVITALRDDLTKKVGLHNPGDYMQPVLGDLVVLINPAAEAEKWIDVQRAVWRRVPMSAAERRTAKEYETSHFFFGQDQAPIMVSATAARDWPPGGRRETDCASPTAETNAKVLQARAVAQEGFNYDWATYDLFPAFKGDFRPIADTLERYVLGVDPHDACDDTPVSPIRRVVTAPVVGFSLLLRVLPFMQTDPEQTRTLGHLDPPRAPLGTIKQDRFSAHPLGTTHELRGIDSASDRTRRYRPSASGENEPREHPLPYESVGSAEAACPVANGWLLRARLETERADAAGQNHGSFWNSAMAGANAPALQFVHGFKDAGIAAITRANDPFWNMRAFDTALALHDGYMLSSFICAMNQLVMDDIVSAETP
jgi:hypothetical protein